MSQLTVVILTYNEGIHLARALGSVANIAAEIIIIDSFSTDNTLSIAKAYNARIFQNPFINQAKQFQWAMDNVEIRTEWVMRLDADELIGHDLADEITLKLPLLDENVSGINLKRKTIFLGRWIRHGGRYPLILLRIWRRGKVIIEDRWMDEHILLTEGKLVTLDGEFLDHNLHDLTYFIDKHNKYSTREAVELLNWQLKFFEDKNNYVHGKSSKQVARKKFLKDRIYNYLPFWLSSFAYFCFRYLMQLGFLDGRPGLIYHFLQGFWYRFLVGAKTLELKKSLVGVESQAEIKQKLAVLTGLKLL